MVKKEVKEKDIEKTVEETVKNPTDDRQVAWEKFLAKAEKLNPVKFASKKANGEFDKIPDSFKG